MSRFAICGVDARKEWKKRLAWMTAAEQDAVELAVLRYLEWSSGYTRTADDVLHAVTAAIEPRRKP